MGEPPRQSHATHHGAVLAAAVCLAACLAPAAARSETGLPGIAEPGAGPTPEDAFLHRNGIVILPSWVGLVSGTDQGRAGRVTEGVGAGGMLAVSYGHSSGLAAPAAGVLAPALNPVERRLANLRSAAQLAGDTTLGVRAAMADSREVALDAGFARDGFAERRLRSVGAGATLGLFGRGLTLDGEIAGAQARDTLTDASPNGRHGVAHRLGATLAPIRFGEVSLRANAWHGQAGIGYAAPGGIAADWRENGLGASLAAGPVTVALNAAQRGNNLDRNPAVLTLAERTLGPSLSLSLDRWRSRPTGRMQPGLLLPSALRISATAGHTVGRPEAGGPLTVADAIDTARRSTSVALDWRGQASSTTLAASVGTTDSRQPGKEDADSGDRSLSLTHAVARRDTAFTVALALRHSSYDQPGNRSASDGVNLAAALTHRGGPLGTVVTSVMVDRARNDALDAAGVDVDTTWQAKAAFDLGALPDEADGRVSLAVAVKGNDPDGEEALHSVEMVVGLTGQFSF